MIKDDFGLKTIEFPGISLLVYAHYVLLYLRNNFQPCNTEQGDQLDQNDLSSFPTVVSEMSPSWVGGPV